MTKQSKERRQFKRIVFTLDDGIVGLLDPPGVNGGHPITAQVLIGQDGVARAIRFLGDPETRLVPAKRQTQR